MGQNDDTNSKKWAQKRQDDLKGFEEVSDWIHDNTRRIENEKRKMRHDPYELYNFLEVENKRLQKLDIFFSDKVSNLVTHSTTEKLCDIQQAQIDQTKSQLWNELHKEESIYLKNCRLLFDKFFS